MKKYLLIIVVVICCKLFPAYCQINIDDAFLFQNAINMYNSQKYTKSIQIFNELIKKNYILQDYCHIFIGFSYLKQNIDDKQGIKLINKAIKNKNPYSEFVISELLELYLLNNYEKKFMELFDNFRENRSIYKKYLPQFVRILVESKRYNNNTQAYNELINFFLSKSGFRIDKYRDLFKIFLQLSKKLRNTSNYQLDIFNLGKYLIEKEYVDEEIK